MPNTSPFLTRARRTLLSLLLAACFLLPAMARADIIVTLPPLAGLVSMLEPNAKVHCLLPASGDPHTFQLTPKQAGQLQQAELLIRASRDDGGWSGLDAYPVPTLDLWHRASHAWLRPEEVKSVLPRLAARLQALHPKDKQQIADALTKALALCDRMDSAWRKALLPFKSAGAIMQHPAWLGLCKRFGVPVRAVLEPRHHGGEVTPQRLEKALEIIKAHPDTALWGDNRHSNRALDWLTQHAHSSKPVIILDALGHCGMSWEALMQKNISLLEKK